MCQWLTAPWSMCTMKYPSAVRTCSSTPDATRGRTSITSSNLRPRSNDSSEGGKQRQQDEVSSENLIHSDPPLSHFSLWCVHAWNYSFNICSSVSEFLGAFTFPSYRLLPQPIHHSCTVGIMFPRLTKLSACICDGGEPEGLESFPKENLMSHVI